MNKRGFTLIELVIVVGVLGVIMAATSSVLINAFKANSRVKLTDKLSQDGNWALTELRKNIFGAKGTTITCVGSSAVSFENAQNGVGTTIFCDAENNKIASQSANREPQNIDLINGGSEMPVDCGSFASCNGVPPAVSSVTFSFSLSIGNSAAGSQNYVEKTFNSTVSVRN